MLRDRTIKLSRLDKVDDLSESITQDSVTFAQYLFVSCWTDDRIESIPFWHMYTPSMAGVRVRLPRAMFKPYTLESAPDRGMQADFTGCVLPLERLHGDGYIAMPEHVDNFQKIEYTDDQSLLHPKLYQEQEDGRHKINFGLLGKYKRGHWSFQSEWRFRLLIMPSAPPPRGSYGDQRYANEFLKNVVQIVHGRPPPFDSFMLELDETAMRQMQVVSGPKCTEGDLALIEALLESHCPSATFERSELEGSIR